MGPYDGCNRRQRGFFRGWQYQQLRALRGSVLPAVACRYYLPSASRAAAHEQLHSDGSTGAGGYIRCGERHLGGFRRSMAYSGTDDAHHDRRNRPRPAKRGGIPPSWMRCRVLKTALMSFMVEASYNTTNTIQLLLDFT